MSFITAIHEAANKITPSEKHKHPITVSSELAQKQIQYAPKQLPAATNIFFIQTHSLANWNWSIDFLTTVRTVISKGLFCLATMRTTIYEFEIH